MDNPTAGKVMEFVNVQPSLGMPSPMSDDWINETSDHYTVYQVRDKVTPLS